PLQCAHICLEIFFLRMAMDKLLAAFQLSRKSMVVLSNDIDLFSAEGLIGSVPPEEIEELINIHNIDGRAGFLSLWQGLAHSNQGSFSSAIREYKKAIELGCASWRVKWYLAIAGSKIGDIELVDSSCKDVLSIIPKFWYAHTLPYHVRGYYSQIGQDKFIEEFFNLVSPKNKIFVDVGAFDGVNFSNVRRLVETYRWSGLCIEPVSKNFDLLKSSYSNPEIKCIHAAVGTDERIAEMNVSQYIHLPDWGSDSASLHVSHIDAVTEKYGAKWNTEQVSVKKLFTILQENDISAFDFLSIDTEGSDFDALSSLDFSKYQPLLIMIEYNDAKKKIRQFLNLRGYTVIYDNGQDIGVALRTSLSIPKYWYFKTKLIMTLIFQIAKKVVAVFDKYMNKKIIRRILPPFLPYSSLVRRGAKRMKCEDGKLKIIGLVRARNEEDTIEFCLRALAKVTDSIIYLDDHSEDSSFDIVQSLQVELKIEKIITKEGAWKWQENADRTMLLQTGRENGGTHFIVIDADEAITSNFLANNLLRKMIFGLNPGDLIKLSLINLWRGVDQFRVYRSYSIPTIFCDDSTSTMNTGFTHFGRIPVSTNGNIYKLMGYKYGLLHFQFVNWEKLSLKQAWYKCLEHVFLPNKSINEINNLYSLEMDESRITLRNSLNEWFHQYSFFKKEIFERPDKWRKSQVLNWFEQYGKSYFYELDIWNIPWDGLPN
ncbi:MAG: FkbM family methyltransferase, partial [Promethearchaeota archaeon]